MKRVPLSDGAAATLAELAKYHGRTQREMLEGGVNLVEID